VLMTIVSHEVQDEEWNIDRLIELIEREIDARERASTGSQTQRKFCGELATVAVKWHDSAKVFILLSEPLIGFL